MKTLLVFLMLTGLVIADALPDMPMNSIRSANSTVPDCETNVVLPSNPQPVWNNLESMSVDERANSRIEIELGSSVGSDAKQIAISIENLWNSGQYSAALALFDDLSKLIDPGQIAVGISWRVPIRSEETVLWGTDVRIGTRDTLEFISFDIDRASGHLFAVVGGNDGEGSHFYVNISLDNGSTWGETYAWFGGGSGGTLRSVSAAVVSDYCYLGYSAADQPTNCRMRRFLTDTGGVDIAYGYHTVFSTTDPEYIKEVCVFANQEAFDNRIYISGITSTGVLKFLWDTGTDGITWTDISPDVSDADRGLDGTFNQDNELRFIFLSYYDTDDIVKIWSYNGSIWEFVQQRTATASAEYTSISAYNDLIICAYDDENTTIYCPYTISRDGGVGWNIGELGGGELPSESPDVTAKLGAGLGATFRYYAEPREQHFTYRGYDPGVWPVDEVISDRAPYYNKSAIEYIGSGTYGIVYLSWNVAPYQAAYFDKGTVGCSYILGDINGNGAANGIDVSYGVVYFKGGPPPPVSCPSCPETAPFYAAGDVNGNCVFNGIDISYFVVYLKGGPALHSCSDCPPAGGALGASIPRNSDSQIIHDNSNSISGE